VEESKDSTASLEPISKLLEQDHHVRHLDEAKVMGGGVFPAHQEPTLTLYLGEESFHRPALFMYKAQLNCTKVTS